MIPTTLEEWSLPIIERLLEQRYIECEAFDWKEMLPTDDSGKKRLKKTCVAFANSSGGFLVFGVADASDKSSAERMCGLDSNPNFAEHFGNYPRDCTPSIQWEPKNPPLVLKNGRHIHVIQIFRSWNAPHCLVDPKEGMIFCKRTNKGDESMSYEEVRMQFLHYQEKRDKLAFLLQELKFILQQSSELVKAESPLGTAIPTTEFSLSVLESLLSETYAVFSGHQDVFMKINDLRQACFQVNLLRMIYLSTGGQARLSSDYNNQFYDGCRKIQEAAGQAITLLTAMIDDVQPTRVVGKTPIG